MPISLRRISSCLALAKPSNRLVCHKKNKDDHNERNLCRLTQLTVPRLGLYHLHQTASLRIRSVGIGTGVLGFHPAHLLLFDCICRTKSVLAIINAMKRG